MRGGGCERGWSVVSWVVVSGGGCERGGGEREH